MRLFSKLDMNVIERCAAECSQARSGELSVADTILATPHAAYFDDRQRAIVRFCAEECKRQKSGPTSVFWMLTAYDHAHFRHASGLPLTVEFIEELYRMVEPHENRYGFRKTNCYVAEQDLIPWRFIPQQLSDLVEAVNRTEPEPLAPLEFYFYFEKRIHAGGDGNGRVGAILYNWLSATLDGPVQAPDIFGCHTEQEGDNDNRKEGQS